MKNKFLNMTALMMIGFLLLRLPASAQTEPSPNKTEKKEDLSNPSGKLEERNQSNMQRENDDRNYDQRRMHRGGKQNFRSREYGNRFENRGFRHFQYRHHGYGPGFNGQRFRSREFRNYGFRGEGFRSRGFSNRGFRGYGRPELRGNDFKARGFNRNQGRPGQFNRMHDPAIKSLRDNIWKDGKMDLKEREMLKNKIKEFRSQNPRQFNQKRNESIPNPPADKN